jgi:hypothetical protein
MKIKRRLENAFRAGQDIQRVVVPITIIIQFNSLFIYVLSSIAGGQLQSQHGKQIQQSEQNTHKENKTRKN